MDTMNPHSSIYINDHLIQEWNYSTDQYYITLDGHKYTNGKPADEGTFLNLIKTVVKWSTDENGQESPDRLEEIPPKGTPGAKYTYDETVYPSNNGSFE
jgi:hypothetical protein